jgi:hypothetical protein
MFDLPADCFSAACQNSRRHIVSSSLTAEFGSDQRSGRKRAIDRSAQ